MASTLLSSFGLSEPLTVRFGHRVYTVYLGVVSGLLDRVEDASGRDMTSDLADAARTSLTRRAQAKASTAVRRG